MKKKSPNNDAPATEHDLAMLGGHLSSRIDDVEENIAEVKEEMRNGFASLNKVLENILFVVQTIEGRAQETRGDHEQIEKHEERITAVEVQVRMLQK